MTRHAGARRRGGWRSKGSKVQVYVRVYKGQGGLKTATFSRDSTAEARRKWIDDTYTDYRRKHPRGTPGTLAGDVPRYLELLVDRPALKRDREFQLAWWCARFGSRPRWSLEPTELEAALKSLLADGVAASTVKKYRTALFHLFTKLDGKRHDNPLRDVPPPREPDALPRAIPYEIIDEIFRHMLDRRYERKLDPATASRLYADAIVVGANRSAVAKAYGVSETMVRKIVNRRSRRCDRASQTKARLQVMAYVGLPPALIRALEPDDYDRDEPSVLARGRKKGGGTRPERLPLTPRGVEAMNAFVAADAFEQVQRDGRRTAFSMSSALKVWRGAIRRMCDALEHDVETRAAGQQLRRELAVRTPYDLRHSFLTEVQLATGNIHATQRMATHADPRTTRRYTLAAVAPELKGVAVLLAARLAGQRPVGQPAGNQMSATVSSSVENRRDPSTRPIRRRTANARPKLRKIS
jgi:integrase